jgi:hypothetical protein
MKERKDAITARNAELKEAKEAYETRQKEAKLQAAISK